MNGPREAAQLMLGNLIHAQAIKLCEGALALADLGGGVSITHALETDHSSSRAVVVLLCGPIPDDLVNALGHYAQSLTQDLKTSGHIKTIHAD